MLSTIKEICETLAYISAAAFFLFKAISGAFYVSLSLNLNTEKRKKLNEKEELLVINLELTGGENALLNIYSVQGKISYGNEISKVFDFEGIERLTVNNENNSLTIINPWIPDKTSKYRVSVKETTSFAQQLTIPANSICRIEIIVIGSRKKIFSNTPTISQWRISHISLPG